MIPYGRQLIEEDDIEAVARVLRSDRITQGPEVDAFEKELAAYCGYKRAVCVANGTLALELACHVVCDSAFRPIAGITSALTFKASASCFQRLGLNVGFLDIDPSTWNMVGICSTRELPVVVDFAGLPCDLSAVTESRLPPTFIRDACHSLGARWPEKASMTCLSFHPVKAITTGEGGCVLTDNDTYYERLKALRHHCLRDERTPGYNARMDEMSAALGRSQLHKLARFVSRRRSIAAFYRDQFAAVPHVQLQADHPEHAYHLFVLWLDPAHYDRDAVRTVLARNFNIGTQVHYRPLADLPNAMRYYAGAMTIPLYPALTDAEVMHIATAVKVALIQMVKP